MNRYLVEIFWSDEDEGYVAIIPDLPGCSAWGKSMQDAAREIQEAQVAWIGACRASGEGVPTPNAQARQAD
jgi:predicted RNase H-like HicB family nuclease